MIARLLGLAAAILIIGLIHEAYKSIADQIDDRTAPAMPTMSVDIPTP